MGSVICFRWTSSPTRTCNFRCQMLKSDTLTIISISAMMNRLLSAIPSTSRSASVIRPIVPTGRTQYVRSTIQSSRFYSTRPTPTGLDEGEKAIYEKLAAKFPGDRLEVQDVSGMRFCLHLGKADDKADVGHFTLSRLAPLRSRVYPR